jgi:hypothetical protein
MVNTIYEATGGALTPTESKMLNTSTVAFDFTTACAFDLTAQWGAAQGTESITGTNVAAYVPGAPVTSVAGATGATLPDFTYASNTLQATATGKVDLNLAPATTGFRVPVAAGAAPTVDGQLAMNSTNHHLEVGSNGATVDLQAGSGYNTVQANGGALTARSILNFVGDCITGVDVGGTTTTIRDLNSRTSACIWDEFIGGSLSAGQIGALGWQFVNNGSGGTLHSYQAIAGHPGVLQLQTPTSAGNQDQYLYLSNNGGDQFDLSETFDTTTIFQMVTNDNTSQMRLCVMKGTFASPVSSATNSPNDSICIEKVFADTSWFGITRAAGTADTRTAAIASCDTSWHYFEIKRVDANTIGFAIDGGSVQCITTAGSLPGACSAGVTSATHIPTGGAGFEVQVEASNTVAHQFNTDRWTNFISGLTR